MLLGMIYQNQRTFPKLASKMIHFLRDSPEK